MDESKSNIILGENIRNIKIYTIQFNFYDFKNRKYCFL